MQLIRQFSKVRNIALCSIAAISASAALLFAGGASASPPTEKTTNVERKAEADALAAKLRKSMPGLVIDSIRPAPMSGMWELVSGGDVAYFTADGVYMIQGTLFNVQDRRNISEEALTVGRAQALASISKAALIVYPAKGKAKHTITVFTDPSCPFCQRLHAEIPVLNEMGVTVQYAPYARSGNGTLTNRQMQEVLCADDPKSSMESFMGSPNKNSSGADCKGAQELVLVSKVANQVGLKGTPHIVTDAGKAMSGYMPAKELLSALQGK